MEERSVAQVRAFFVHQLTARLFAQKAEEQLTAAGRQRDELSGGVRRDWWGQWTITLLRVLICGVLFVLPPCASSPKSTGPTTTRPRLTVMAMRPRGWHFSKDGRPGGH